MSEEASEIDPAAEARRIANKSLSELGWAKEFKNQVIRQLIPPIERDVKLRQAEEMELAADEHFGAAVDSWRAERSDLSKAVLKEIVNRLGKRADLTFFGQRIVRRLKDELR
jgi:hypothetical protein